MPKELGSLSQSEALNRKTAVVDYLLSWAKQHKKSRIEDCSANMAANFLMLFAKNISGIKKVNFSIVSHKNVDLRSWFPNITPDFCDGTARRFSPEVTEALRANITSILNSVGIPHQEIAFNTATFLANLNPSTIHITFFHRPPVDRGFLSILARTQHSSATINGNLCRMPFIGLNIPDIASFSEEIMNLLIHEMLHIFGFEHMPVMSENINGALQHCWGEYTVDEYEKVTSLIKKQGCQLAVDMKKPLPSHLFCTANGQGIPLSPTMGAIDSCALERKWAEISTGTDPKSCPSTEVRFGLRQRTASTVKPLAPKLEPEPQHPLMVVEQTNYLGIEKHRWNAFISGISHTLISNVVRYTDSQLSQEQQDGLKIICNTIITYLIFEWEVAAFTLSIEAIYFVIRSYLRRRNPDYYDYWPYVEPLVPIIIDFIYQIVIMRDPRKWVDSMLVFAESMFAGILGSLIAQLPFSAWEKYRILSKPTIAKKIKKD